ncbi:MAG: PatB family C-S lyase [Pseudomonadota bacterium]
MEFDFDTPIGLRNTHCQKWDNLSVLADTGAPGTPEDTIPMWVADMDFAAPPPVLTALRAEAARGYCGYFGIPEPVAEAVAGWMTRTHGWALDPDHVRFTVGVIGGLKIALEAVTQPGDGVIVFPPVYHAFYRVLDALDREVVESPLILQDGRHQMDLDALEASLTGRERAVIFCSPHNPGGRIWQPHEIQALAAFCARHDLTLIADEIHMDLTFPGETFHPTASTAPDCLERLIVLSAASKGFNLAGGETGFAVIPDKAMRERYDLATPRAGAGLNRFGMVMTKAAFSDGDTWSAAVRAYLADNFALWRERVGALPGVHVVEMSSTYLTWIDFRGTGMTHGEIRKRIADGARIASSPGTQFGTGGECHNRFNIAMPRPLLIEAITRMEAAFADLQ